MYIYLQQALTIHRTQVVYNNNNNRINGHGHGTVRSRFLGGKDNFLKCLKHLFFGIVYSQKFPIIASIIIYKND